MRSLLAVYFDQEIISCVLLLKIVNFILNCSFESFPSGKRLSIYNFLLVCFKNCFNAVKKKKIEPKILEEGMRIWLTSVQELTPIT